MISGAATRILPAFETGSYCCDRFLPGYKPLHLGSSIHRGQRVGQLRLVIFADGYAQARCHGWLWEHERRIFASLGQEIDAAVMQHLC